MASKCLNFTTSSSDKIQNVGSKGKRISLKTTNENGSRKEVNTIIVSDESSSPNEEKMALLAEKFTRFFRNKKSSSGGVRRDNSSKRGLRSMENNNDSEDESKKQRRKSHVIKIKCFEYGKPSHIATNCFPRRKI